MILLAVGVAVAVVGASLLREEWARPQRPPRKAMRLEAIVAAGVLIGLGVAMAYAGIRP